jgi:hypothetical protein
MKLGKRNKVSRREQSDVIGRWNILVCIVPLTVRQKPLYAIRRPGQKGTIR